MSSAFSVVITRSEEQAEDFAERLASFGFETVSVPVVRTIALPPEGWRTQRVELSSGVIDWLLLSSANGARFLAEALQIDGNVSLPEGIRIACQGPVTAAEVERCFARKADFVPERAVSENFLDELVRVIASNASVFYPHSEQSRGVLVNLKSKVRLFRTAAIYRTEGRVSLEKDELERLSRIRQGLVTFFSPSAVSGFLSLIADIPEFLNRAKICTIGPVTSEAVRRAGLTVDLEAEEHTADGLAFAIQRKYSDK